MVEREDRQQDELQQEVMELLLKKMNKYVGADSSSVRVETARQLAESMDYCISFYRGWAMDQELAELALPGALSAEIMLREGERLVQEQTEEAKNLLMRLQKNRLSISNLAYHDTIMTGLPLFFKGYDVEYAAHDTPGMIDYPLSYDPMVKTGIAYIYEYLCHLELEEAFCRRFASQSIERLLNSYFADAAELLINVYELVLTNALGRQLLDRNRPGGSRGAYGEEKLPLLITEAERGELESILSGYSAKERQSVIKESFLDLCESFGIQSSGDRSYLQQALEAVFVRLEINLTEGTLEKVFLDGR